MGGLFKMALKLILDIVRINDAVQFVEFFELDAEYQELFHGRVDDSIHELLGYSLKDVMDNLIIRLEEREDCYSSIKLVGDEEYEVELYDLVEEDEDAEI